MWDHSSWTMFGLLCFQCFIHFIPWIPGCLFQSSLAQLPPRAHFPSHDVSLDFARGGHGRVGHRLHGRLAAPRGPGGEATNSHSATGGCLHVDTFRASGDLCQGMAWGKESTMRIGTNWFCHCVQFAFYSFVDFCVHYIYIYTQIYYCYYYYHYYYHCYYYYCYYFIIFFVFIYNSCINFVYIYICIIYTYSFRIQDCLKTLDAMGFTSHRQLPARRSWMPQQRRKKSFWSQMTCLPSRTNSRRRGKSSEIGGWVWVVTIASTEAKVGTKTLHTGSRRRFPISYALTLILYS